MVQTVRELGYSAKLDRLPDNGIRLSVEMSLTRSHWVEFGCTVEGGRAMLVTKNKAGTRTTIMSDVKEKTFATILQRFIIEATFGRL